MNNRAASTLADLCTQVALDAGVGEDLTQRGEAFADLYAAKSAKAVAKITDDLDVLLTFYEYRPSTGCMARRRWRRVGSR